MIVGDKLKKIIASVLFVFSLAFFAHQYDIVTMFRAENVEKEVKKIEKQTINKQVDKYENNWKNIIEEENEQEEDEDHSIDKGIIKRRK